ncbi:MAG: stage V sporulation protein S [Candidatus Bipolaricaulota bacterium]
MENLKVASGSNPNSVSGAIVASLEQCDVVQIHAVGAGAVNQAVKAIAIARRALERPGDRPLRVVPGFVDLSIDGETKTAVRLFVER